MRRVKEAKNDDLTAEIAKNLQNRRFDCKKTRMKKGGARG